MVAIFRVCIFIVLLNRRPLGICLEEVQNFSKTIGSLQQTLDFLEGHGRGAGKIPSFFRRTLVLKHFFLYIFCFFLTNQPAFDVLFFFLSHRNLEWIFA